MLYLLRIQHVPRKDQKCAPFVGIIGDWKNTFTVAQNERFDDLYRREMEGFTMDLIYESWRNIWSYMNICRYNWRLEEHIHSSTEWEVRWCVPEGDGGIHCGFNLWIEGVTCIKKRSMDIKWWILSLKLRWSNKNIHV